MKPQPAYLALVRLPVMLLLLALADGYGGFLQAQGAPAAKYQDKKREANENVVTLMASSAVAPYTRYAEDIQSVLDDTKTNTMRVLPVLGKGGGQNLLDLLFLKGVDMGIVEQDHPETFREKEPALHASIHQRVHYITKLFDSEFHLLAPKEVKSLEDLRGKKVSFYNRNSSTHLAAEKIFKTLGIEVQPVFLDTELHNEQLRSGEIAGVVRVSGAPHNAFASFKREEGFHFLPLDPAHLPATGKNLSKLYAIFLPAQLKHEHYPNLIPPGETVPTVANAAVLAAYAWPENTERYRKVAQFVKSLFDNVEKLRDGPRHPKWKEINLAAQIPGWTRFKAAQQWLDAHKASGTAATQSGEIKTAFEKFMQDYTKASGAKDLTAEQREALFTQFMKWSETQKAGKPSR